MEDNILRLAKPRKKGLLGFVFSRFLIILILLLLQAFVYVALFVWLERYVSHFYVIMTLFTLVMVVYLFMSQIDASAKLTWLLIMAVLPFVGAFLLWYTQTNFGHRKLKERAEELIRETRTAIPQSEKVTEKLKTDGGDTEDLAKYLSRSGCFPVYDHTEVTYFPLGEDKFEAMLAELEKAKHFIFMEYFIIEEGYMWGKILEILIRKAAEGVDVRVMYDGMCEMSTLPADYWKLLQKQGIQAKPFAPIVPILSTHYNYRDH
ncbi:MAG: cardiolipin synthase, partial [Eubacterium sp.]|nr:cardiolipin synthase [Eubacterium sp.]